MATVDSAPAHTRFLSPAVGGLTNDQTVDYETAVSLLGALIARSSAKIAITADRAEIKQLRAEQARNATQQEKLDPRVAEAVASVISDARRRLGQPSPS